MVLLALLSGVFFASGPAFSDGLSPTTVQTMIDRAQPGDNLRLSGNIRLENSLIIDGKRDLIIIGSPQAVIDGGRVPESPRLQMKDPAHGAPVPWNGLAEWIPNYVDFASGFSSLIIRNSSGVKISGLRFISSWPNSIKIENSTNIELSDLDFAGGTNAIYALGSKTQGIKITRCQWNQDETEQVWSSLDWSHVHHGQFNYYNGAFFQARDILGAVSITHSVVRNAFNGVRLKTTPSACPIIPNCELSKDVTISDNTFVNISDNVLEPEGFAQQWRFSGNRLIGFHAPISLTGVHLREIQITGNTFIASSPPRQLAPKPLPGQSYHRHGKVFKFLERGILSLSGAFGVRVNGNRFDRLPSFPGGRIHLTDSPEFFEQMEFFDNTASDGIIVNSTTP
ncbi:MAG: right-handed parallel beta-helix repeat-containing protein [Bdellovibrionales bacterium]|nr:right-handed parallel beta-helix repeat-containing protein [Bdellovibrionales bacterium]